MRWLFLAWFCALLCFASAADVPIYEREVPTDPVELKKYMAEMERALKQVDEAPKEEAARARAAVKAAVQAPEVAIPERDDEEINLASRRKLTDRTVAADVVDLVKRLRAGLDATDVADAGRWIKVYDSNPAALASGAAMAWVQGAPGPALLMAAEAAKRAPQNANVLNTLGSLLADAGYGSRGIPILDYLAGKFPKDPTLQNNLGQAWLGLGEPKKAEFHLLACLRLAPGHSAAHAAMGVIKSAAGDQAAAAKHFQAAASSSGSAVARRALHRLNQGFQTPRSFRRIAPVEEHFNLSQFVVPAASETMAGAETKTAEEAAFQALLNEQMEIAEARGSQAGEALGEHVTAKPNLAYLATLGGGTALNLARVSDASEGRLRRAGQLIEDVAQLGADTGATWDQAEARVTAMREEFAATWKGKDIGEGGAASVAYIAAAERLCPDERKIMDGAWKGIAGRYNQFVAAATTRERVGTNELLTYLPLAVGGDLYRVEFYQVVMEHLLHLGMIAGANPIRRYDCGGNPLAEKFPPPEGELPGLGECPIHVNAKFSGFKLKADCKSIGFDFEAGLKFSAKKDFQSGETTLKGGVGVDMDLKGAGSVEGSGAFVLMWDRGNDLSFIGVESSASASLAGIPALAGEMDVEGVEDGKVGGSLPATGTSDIVKVSSETTLGVTLGPRGVEPTLRGNAGIEVLGRDLVRAEL